MRAVLVRGVLVVSRTALCFFASLSSTSLPALEGRLYRRRQRASLWFRRYFVLREGSLYQLQDSGDRLTHAARILAMRDVAAVQVLPLPPFSAQPPSCCHTDSVRGQSYHSVRGKQHCFQCVRRDGRREVFSCDSAVQQGQWMERLRQSLLGETAKLRYARLVRVEPYGGLLVFLRCPVRGCSRDDVLGQHHRRCLC